MFHYPEKNKEIDSLYLKEVRGYQTVPDENISNFNEAELNDANGKNKDFSIKRRECEGVTVDENVMSSHFMFCVLIATMSQFLVGYNSDVMNTLVNVVFPGHSKTAWSLAVAAFAIGAPFGSFMAGDMINKKGRRRAFIISMWIFVIGGVIQSLALDMSSIIVARVIIGFASGFSTVLVPVYLSEIAPPKLRGSLGTMTQFSLVIGIFMSKMLAFLFATTRLWRVLFVVTPMIAIIQILLASQLLLESPRWLLNLNEDSNKARIIIRKLRGLENDDQVDEEVGYFLSACEKHHQDHSWKELFNDESVRILLISALILQMSQKLSGINAVFYYSTTFFNEFISSPLLATTVIGGLNVVSAYVALLLMDSYGRRTLLLWSTGGMLFSCIGILLAMNDYLNKIMALLAVNLFVIFFELGLGPIPWLIVPEMFDAKYIAKVMSITCQFNWVSNFIADLVLPHLVSSLGSFTFLPFAIVLLFTFVFVLCILPETYGTKPEELQAKIVPVTLNVVTEEKHYYKPIDLEWKIGMDNLRKDEEEAMREGTFNYGFHPIDSINY